MNSEQANEIVVRVDAVEKFNRPLLSAYSKFNANEKVTSSTLKATLQEEEWL